MIRLLPILLLALNVAGAELTARLPGNLHVGLIRHYTLERGLNPYYDLTTRYWFDSLGQAHLTEDTVANNFVYEAPGIMKGCANFSTASPSTGYQYLWVQTTLGNPSMDYLSNTNFMVAWWFNVTNNPAANYGEMVHTRPTTGAQWATDIFVSSGVLHGIRWYCYTNQWLIVTVTNPPILANQWNLFCGWRNDTEWGCRVYTPNGDPVTTNVVITTPVVASAANLMVGNSYAPAPANQYYGMIDSFSIWNRMLTTNEMDMLWNGGNGLIDYYIK